MSSSSVVVSPTPQPSQTEKVLARIRLATVSDVPEIHQMIQQSAEMHGETDQCTESLLSSILFPTTPNPIPPFHSFTVLILDLRKTHNNNNNKYNPNESIPNPHFAPVLHEVDLQLPAGKEENRWEVAGFTLFFPNYASFKSKAGFYVEDVFVREQFRRHGFGTLLLSAVAKKAAEMGKGVVEWSVTDWNVNAMNFYEEKMGASVLPEWRICRLTGDALQAYAHAD